MSDITPFDEVLPDFKSGGIKNYGHKVHGNCRKNYLAIDRTLELLCEIQVPSEWAFIDVPERKSTATSRYVREIVEPINRQEGNQLSVGTLVRNQNDGRSDASRTTAVEKRGIALVVPEWLSDRCTMCNECAHLFVRMQRFDLS